MSAATLERDHLEAGDFLEVLSIAGCNGVATLQRIRYYQQVI